MITALGRTWHPGCFACCQCNMELGTQHFFERDGKPFCEQCYHALFSPRYDPHVGHNSLLLVALGARGAVAPSWTSASLRWTAPGTRSASSARRAAHRWVEQHLSFVISSVFTFSSGTTAFMRGTMVLTARIATLVSSPPSVLDATRPSKTITFLR